jgi:hypothetical protein
MRATTNEHDHQRMIEETDMEAKEGDLAIMTTTAPTTKYLQGTKTIAIKGTTVEARGTITTEKKTTEAAKNFRQENPDSTIHRQKIC